MRSFNQTDPFKNREKRLEERVRSEAAVVGIRSFIDLFFHAVFLEVFIDHQRHAGGYNADQHSRKHVRYKMLGKVYS